MSAAAVHICGKCTKDMTGDGWMHKKQKHHMKVNFVGTADPR